jgi:hypothetical protein
MTGARSAPSTWSARALPGVLGGLLRCGFLGLVGGIFVRLERARALRGAWRRGSVGSQAGRHRERGRAGDAGGDEDCSDSGGDQNPSSHVHTYQGLLQWWNRLGHNCCATSMATDPQKSIGNGCEF